VKTLSVTEKTGRLIAIKAVRETDGLMIINKSGIAIRMPVSDLRVMGRATQGVRLIRLDEGDQIASVAKVEEEDAVKLAEGAPVPPEAGTDPASRNGTPDADAAPDEPGTDEA
jgi:DNA gyrase subunit A